ncbi:MAG: leucyl/phenylalanyl-tRNA--protein transferase [Treponema sp.]|jgi:leucyl/phenylalanyl-tRNA--protein transferase|nr:leucyl/phenylalanyl-tRNA--protein transferase [Treponema sp.]
MTVGPDPHFPYLDKDKRFVFPPVIRSSGNIIAVGGNLSPGMLLSAYEQGIFPWYSEDEPLLWQSPDPRFLIFPEDLHISESMKKILKKGIFNVVIDHDFPAVINNCAITYRPGQSGTWITHDMIEAFIELHRLGYVHSAESYRDGQLVGGCYGLLLGKYFCGESMFAKEKNASKAAFLTYAQQLFAQGVACIDCQVYTVHLASLGGRNVPRAAFLRLLRKILKS